ncbi:hypothetical protein [Nonomuraea monospora]
MGEFLAVSAFMTEDADAVRAAAGRFFAAHFCPAATPAASPVTDDDVLLFPPANRWTVVMWPPYFADLAAVEPISRDLEVVASTVRIHDGDYWSHALVRDGVTVDRFASMPDYFTDDAREIARLADKYAGRASVVAEAVGCPVETIAPYFAGGGRAFAEDEFELDDPWVFVDFWGRIGVRYPEDVSAFAGRLRLTPGWLDKLPSGDAEL